MEILFFFLKSELTECKVFVLKKLYLSKKHYNEKNYMNYFFKCLIFFTGDLLLVREIFPLLCVSSFTYVIPLCCKNGTVSFFPKWTMAAPVGGTNHSLFRSLYIFLKIIMNCIKLLFSEWNRDCWKVKERKRMLIKVSKTLLKDVIL